MYRLIWLHLPFSVNIFNNFIEGVPVVILLVNTYVPFYKVSRYLDDKNGASKL